MSFRKQLFLGLFVSALLGAVSVQAQITPRVNQAQVRAVLERLENRTDVFRSAVDRQRGNTGWNNTNRDDIRTYVGEFENATDRLRNNFVNRRETTNDVTDVLNYAWYVDNYVRNNRLGAALNRQWNTIRADLDLLARYYGVRSNWYSTTPPLGQIGQDRWGRGALDQRLTGTYRLNRNLSDNPDTVLDRVLGTRYNRNQQAQDRQRQNLERRLTAPDNLAIEARGTSIQLATNLGQPASFVADGRTQTETNARGRTTRTTVAFSGDTLTINTEGDRGNDFWVSFTPVGTNQLRMTRRIYLEGRNEMITVNSVYDRVSNTAQWPPVNRDPYWRDDRYGNTTTSGQFYVPNGTRLTAVLRDRIGTNISQSGDPFTLEVTSPGQYRGAIITGRITEAESSGRVTGRANLVMDFETIRVGNQVYNFAGIIDSAREADGDTISVSNEGTVRDGSQTTRTVTRAGIGAVLGALIGAVIGGGEGAAIGAGVGAGAGAGSVLIQGRDNIDLQPGSQFSITASAPANLSMR